MCSEKALHIFAEQLASWFSQEPMHLRKEAVGRYTTGEDGVDGAKARLIYIDTENLCAGGSSMHEA
jgi:hypothetical protein